METIKSKLSKLEIREVLNGDRFNMSGYDDFEGESGKTGSGKRGGCVVYNTELLNRFAEFGIYEHTEYLYLDFYKGSPTLYFKYWNEDLGRNCIIDDSEKWKTIYGTMGRLDDNMPGWTTTQIIERILELTVYSGKVKRRVN